MIFLLPFVACLLVYHSDMAWWWYLIAGVLWVMDFSALALKDQK